MICARRHYRLGTFTETAVATLAVGFAAAGFTPANAVHNAGITWSDFGAIHRADVDGSGRHVLVPPGYDEEGDPAWTRDGHALAFFGRYSDTVQIYVLWPKTGRLRALGSGASRSSGPTWSPDAKRIAVSEAWGGFGLSHPEATIRIVSLATNKWTSVTKPRSHEQDVDPAWSPDGRTIAYARRLNSGTPTLFLVRPDGSAARRLTTGRSPSWSPDGKRLAFALGGGVYEIRADGRGRKRVLRGLRNPLVRWSPDGRKLLYTSGGYSSNQVGTADVWAADVDGTHRRRILHGVALDGIEWRPDS
jgi:TolB protein